MKALSHPSAICLLLVVLTSCTGAARPAPPTPVVVPTDLAFSAPLVQVLSQSGLGILSVQRSVYESMFQSTSRAAWI